MTSGSSDLQMSNTDRPLVSVIVPARNEERSLDRCLRSLVTQNGVPFEVIVVDDQSTDGTQQIAESFTRARSCPFLAQNSDLRSVTVLSAATPPAGWTGKANACWTGAQDASGRWLLFTDADTEHLPNSLATAVGEAEAHKVGLLSYSPEQVLSGLAQKMLMPVIFGELATTYKPSEVSDPSKPAAAANGQYLLIRRDVYERIDGHRAVAASLLEDVDLARLAKQGGERLYFRLGRGVVRAYMYSGWRDMREGWIKNLALLFPNAKGLAFARTLDLLSILVFIICANVAAHSGSQKGVLLFLFSAVITLTLIISRIHRAHFSWGYTLLGLFGIPVFCWLLVKSAKAHASKSVLWKGRSYSPSVTSTHSGESNQ